MPRTGRPRKPTALKKAQGTLRKHRELRNEWQPPAGAPDCPATLAGEALAEWQRVVPMLTESGVLTKADSAALEMYCRAWGMFQVFMTELEREPMVEVPVQGGTVKEANPAHKKALEWAEKAWKFGAGFGLDPSSRSNVPSGEKKKDDPVKRFLFGGGGPGLKSIRGGKAEQQPTGTTDPAPST